MAPEEECGPVAGSYLQFVFQGVVRTCQRPPGETSGGVTRFSRLTQTQVSKGHQKLNNSKMEGLNCDEKGEFLVSAWSSDCTVGTNSEKWKRLTSGRKDYPFSSLPLLLPLIFLSSFSLQSLILAICPYLNYWKVEIKARQIPIIHIIFSCSLSFCEQRPQMERTRYSLINLISENLFIVFNSLICSSFIHHSTNIN